MKSIYVINLLGEKEPLSLKKVYRSARHAGADKFVARKAMEVIGREARPGITTTEIYDRIKQLLGKEVPAVAIKFSLKSSLRKLGPSGFPFEKYIAAILTKQGYWVQLNQIIKGYCVDYEIDFLAKKDKELFVGECKYHNVLGFRTDLKVALANHARFLDIKQGNFFNKKEFAGLKISSLLVTNTKFSEQAIDYSNCVGNKLLGWGYPGTNNLQYYIESQKLYPITILPSLKQFHFDIFANKRIMLAEDLLKIDPDKFSRTNRIPLNILLQLIKEAKTLLNN
ncbi:MAG: ATPase [Patescibacteria group bacterium]|nr:ATPase [Patescibacteria group bacterium]MDD5121467.1 ATPase [Patescibacteria group bacterium]MDD5222220.1 ATPase [Patescibacteria group bacterium]MDD5396371.1 ATPase [Patescibacteria group bacterium]